MAAVSLKTPNGLPAAIESSEAILIFFSPYLSPRTAKCNVVLGDSIRSFKNKPEEAANLIGVHEKLARLNLPNIGKNRAKGAIWLRADLVTGVTATSSGEASIAMNRRKGPIIVVESEADANAIIEAARRQHHTNA